MNIVVTGADGFLGRHLVNTLAKQTGVTIKAFDRFSLHKIGQPHPFDKHENVEIVPGDFFNRDDISNLLNSVDYVFHLISTTTPAVSNNDPLIDIDTNIRGSVELFQACVESGVKKVIYFSSGGTVYGDIDSEQISELEPLKPVSPYAIGKVTVENYLRYFEFTHGLDYVVYRIANPYGPGQNIYGKQGVIPIFMRHFFEGEPLTIFGDGSMTRDYIYVEDMMSMIVQTFDKINKVKEYNIGSGKGHTINEIIKAIEKCTDITPIKHHLPVPATYVDRSVLSIDRFVNEYNIKPMTSLETGIERTWQYVKDLEKNR